MRELRKRSHMRVTLVRKEFTDGTNCSLSNATINFNGTSCTNTVTWDSFCVKPGFIFGVLVILGGFWLFTFTFALKCAKARWIRELEEERISKKASKYRSWFNPKYMSADGISMSL
ncbi:hypothetical protein BDZ45DRAFT_751479 [Acephala macrosclerotiorum]|nr:hypothetical protein BDZ45DRAFT_751479 [Acephala macrosclerotiorum]